MTKADIAKHVQEVAGISEHDAEALLEQILEIVKSTLKTGEEITVTGFGKFRVRTKNARIGRNPRRHRHQSPVASVPEGRAGNRRWEGRACETPAFLIQKLALPDVHVIGISAQADTFLKASMKAVGSSAFVTNDCAHTLPDVIAQITGRPFIREYHFKGTS